MIEHFSRYISFAFLGKSNKFLYIFENFTETGFVSVGQKNLNIDEGNDKVSKNAKFFVFRHSN